LIGDDHAWVEATPDEAQRPLAEIAACGPTEDWSEWCDETQ
jgi:hypothetical protein